MKGRVTHPWRWVGLVGAVAFVLGCIGYHQLLQSQGAQPSVSDSIYGSLSLFLFNPPPGTRLPVALDIARFAAPIATGWASVTALTALFRESTNRFKAWQRRGHVIVCGLGFKGAAFVKTLREAGYHVVAIEADATNPAIGHHRRIGVPVIIGDAQSQETLSQARIGRAEWLLALCPDDSVNAEIVLSAYALAQDRPQGRLKCLAQISDPQLCTLLGELPFENENPKWSVTFFNTDDISADLLLDRYPFDRPGSAPHILVAHLDPLGQRVIVAAVQRWRTKRTGQPLVVTVVDDDADARIGKLTEEHGLLAESCTFIPCSTSGRDLMGLASRYRELNVCTPSHAFVTAYDDEAGVATILKLRHRLDAQFIAVLTQSRDYGKGKLLNGLTSVEVFPVFEKACVPDHLVDVSIETLARTIHEIWRDEQRAVGKEDLQWADPRAAGHRESSRAQARDIPAKLRTLGYTLGPATGQDTTEFTLTDEQIEKLAILEHDRWNEERLDSGWTLGPKDIDAKTTPYLVPFKELPDDVAEWDRVFVRKIPQIVASAGFTVRRL